MGNAQSSSGAQFVGSGPTFVASFHPCHVFGDSSLYGVGIRTSYYLQYAAALLSILFLRGGDLKAWFLSFAPLVAANLIVLSLNAAGRGLVILDWAIVFGLVFWSVVFLLRPLFYRRSQVSPGTGGDVRKLQQQLEREGGRPVSNHEAAWHSRYLAVLGVLSADEDQFGGRDARWGGKANRQTVLEETLQSYVAAFASARGSPASTEAADYILAAYSNGTRDVAVRLVSSNRQLESFRDIHTEALRRAGIPFEHARGTTQILGRVAGEGQTHAGTQTGRPRRSPLAMLQDFGRGMGTTGTVACGIGLGLYSAYCAFMVWVLFRGIDKGARSGCDIRMILVVVPVSIYNHAAVTTLRVFACLWLVGVGLPALLICFALIGIAAKDWWIGPPSQRKPEGTAADAATFAAVPYDSEKGKETEVASPTSMGRASRASDLLYEMEEYSPTSPTNFRDTRGSSFFGSVVKDTEPAPGIRGGLATKRLGVGRIWTSLVSKWEYLLVIPLVHTIVVVEMTIRINRVDMRQRPMSSVGELLAFFLGAFLFLRVLAGCLHAGATRLRRRQSRDWQEERQRILSAPATRLEDRGFSGGGALRKEVSIGGSSIGREAEAGKGKHLPRRLYMQPEGKTSGSSMGKFREMIDDD